MRSNITKYSGGNRTAEVKLYRGVSSYEIVNGTAVELLDLSELCGRISITDNSATAKLTFNTELFDCLYQPRPSDLLGITVDGILRSVTLIDQVSDFVEERGSRSMTVKGRSRDGFDGWKVLNTTSPNFGMGANFVAMMETVCHTLMTLNSEEYFFQTLNFSNPHADLQFSNETPWAMLVAIAFAANMEPFVDVLNRVRTFNVDTLRTHDIEISNDEVVSFQASSQVSSSGTNSIKLSWLDPILRKQYQENQILSTQTITAGFFKLCVKREIWFSEDRTQRAEDTYMKIVDSANNGLLGIRVVDEEYDQKDVYHGEIRLTTPIWVPILYTVELGVLLYLSSVPDETTTPGGPTVPYGRILHGQALVVMLGIMMAIGTGTYEIWGQPYDYIHAKNFTIVRASNIPYYAISQTELESNLILNEAHAQAIMVKHLLYLHSGNYGMEATIEDDPRIEVGDILLFEDGSRIMVKGFSNDFTRGSPADMRVQGILL